MWLLLLLALLLGPRPAQAALPNTVQWEVRSTGSDSNGGGFDSAGSGTDYSQQNAAQFSNTDGANVALSTTFTSAAGTFTAQAVGNIMQITADGVGTCTLGFYEVTAFTNATTVTLDRSPCTVNGTSITYAVGGGLLTIQKGLNAISIGDQWVWIKKATYNLTVGLTVPATSPVQYGTRIIGYNTAHGDNPLVGSGNQPVIASNGNGINILTLSQQGFRVEYLTFDCSTATKGLTGLNITAHYQTIYAVKALNCSTAGITSSADFDGVFYSEVTGSGGTYAVLLGNYSQIAGSYIHDNTNGTVAVKMIDSSRLVGNVIANNPGAGAHGAVLSLLPLAVGNVFYNNGGDGIQWASVYMLNIAAWIRNNVFDSNGGWGLNLASAPLAKGIPGEAYNGFRNNTSGDAQNVTLSSTDVVNASFSGSPFTNAGTGDWSLNNTAGQGALLRSVGFPAGALPALTNPTTSAPDIGVYRHTDPAGGSTNGVVGG